MRNLLIALVVMFSFAACTQTTGTRVDSNVTGKFIKGKTTYAEVVAALGKPASSNVLASGDKIIFYNMGQSKVSATTYIPIVGGLIGSTSSGGEQHIFTFNEKQILKQHTVSEYGDMVK